MIWRGVVGKVWLAFLACYILFGSFVVFIYFPHYRLLTYERAEASLVELTENVIAVDQPLSLGEGINIVPDGIEAFNLDQATSPYGLVWYDNKQVLAIAHNASNLVVYQESLYIEEEIASQARTFLAIYLLVFTLVSGVSFFISNGLKKRLKPMRMVALEYAKLNFDKLLPVDKTDDLSEVSLALNRMRRQISNQLAYLSQEKLILHRVIHSMQEGVFTVNIAGEIILSNRNATRLLQAFNYEFNAVDKETLPKQFLELISPVVNAKEASELSITVQGRDYQMILTPLRDDEFVKGVVVIIRDITEEVQLNHLREAFIANVSHELRTPISLLQGYSEAIVDGVYETKEEQQMLAEIIHDESLRMGRLVNDLLDLARMKSGQVDLNKDEYPVIDFAERIVKKFQARAESLGIKLRLKDVGDSISYLSFDYDRIDQVLTNLIDNAMRHTSKGNIDLLIKDEKNHLRFLVEDSGAGISNEDLPFVFERFYKADKSRVRDKQNKKGTGLGLSIAKQIVEAHGGEIMVQSKEGIGTTFSFTIPKN